LPFAPGAAIVTVPDPFAENTGIPGTFGALAPVSPGEKGVSSLVIVI
jgi:hypothetical protein